MIHSFTTVAPTSILLHDGGVNNVTQTNKKGKIDYLLT